MAESVFTSIPFSSAIVAKVWRRSWKRTCLQCARSSMMRKRLVIAVGFLGSPSFTGDGKIQSYFAILFISRSRSSMSGGRRTVLIELLVFGTDMPLVVSCRLIFSSPVSRLRSISELCCQASDSPTSVRQIDAEEYSIRRPDFLPKGSILQENENIFFCKRKPISI